MPCIPMDCLEFHLDMLRLSIQRTFMWWRRQDYSAQKEHAATFAREVRTWLVSQLAS